MLPILERLLTFVTNNILPVIQRFTDSFGGANGLGSRINQIVTTVKTVLTPVFEGALSLFNRIKNAVLENRDSFEGLANLITTYIAPVIGKVLGGALKGLGFIAEGIIKVIATVAKIITATVEAAIGGINTLIKAYNAVPLLPNIPLIPTGAGSPVAPSAPSIRAVERGVPTASAPAASAVAHPSSATLQPARPSSDATQLSPTRHSSRPASRFTGL